MEFDNPRARKSNRIRIPDAIALFHGTAKTLDRKFHLVQMNFSKTDEIGQLYCKPRCINICKPQKPTSEPPLEKGVSFLRGFPRNNKTMFPAGIEPATLRVWGARDNHYTTETQFLIWLRKCIYKTEIQWDLEKT